MSNILDNQIKTNAGLAEMNSKLTEIDTKLDDIVGIMDSGGGGSGGGTTASGAMTYLNAAYSSTVTYAKGDVVTSGVAPTRDTFVSLMDNNKGNALPSGDTDTAYWARFPMRAKTVEVGAAAPNNERFPLICYNEKGKLVDAGGGVGVVGGSYLYSGGLQVVNQDDLFFSVVGASLWLGTELSGTELLEGFGDVLSSGAGSFILSGAGNIYIGGDITLLTGTTINSPYVLIVGSGAMMSVFLDENEPLNSSIIVYGGFYLSEFEGDPTMSGTAMIPIASLVMLSNNWFELIRIGSPAAMWF